MWADRTDNNKKTEDNKSLEIRLSDTLWNTDFYPRGFVPPERLEELGELQRELAIEMVDKYNARSTETPTAEDSYDRQKPLETLYEECRKGAGYESVQEDKEAIYAGMTKAGRGETIDASLSRR